MNRIIRINLSLLRFSHGRLSQKAVSEATGIGQKTLSALETGASKGIEFNTLLKLCMFFKCSPGELLLIEENEEIEPIPEVSDESRQKAKQLVARGLQAAMQAPQVTPEEVWAEFDAVRLRVQSAADAAEEHKANNRA